MLKKNYLKTGNLCQVTFILPEEVNTKTAVLCGDFNNWDTQATPMKYVKNEGHSVTIPLSVGQSYRFRYFLDDERWENDWNADSYVRNEFGSEDSIVTV
jgi:1,4-alpha-glucan branching enzyme